MNPFHLSCNIKTPNRAINWKILTMAKATKSDQEEPLEKKLWKAADKLRKNINAAEYKHIVLGLIFLKYISDAFEELYQKLVAGEGDYAGADPEDADEYRAENVFWVPQRSALVGAASQRQRALAAFSKLPQTMITL